MEWTGRINYIAAKNEVKQIELYGMDLLWSLVKVNYSSDIPMPSAIWNKKETIDRRSKKQIVAGILKKLGGE